MDLREFWNATSVLTAPLADFKQTELEWEDEKEE